MMNSNFYMYENLEIENLISNVFFNTTLRKRIVSETMVHMKQIWKVKI